MGLLDGNLDPQSMSVLALAGGLLSPGSFGQGLSRGIAGQQQVLSNAQEMELRKQQIATAQQETQMRDLQMQRTRQQLQFGQNFLGDVGGAQSAPSAMPAASAAMGQGASMGSVGPTTDNAARMSAAMPQAITATPKMQSRLASLTEDQIASGVASGVIPKEFVELWTNAKFGRALPPGWKQNLDGSMTYVPDPTKGVTMGPDGKTVQVMPGGPESMGALAGATEEGKLRATNALTPASADMIERAGLRPGSSTSDLLRSAQPAQGAPFSGLPQPMQQAVLRDMQKNGVGTVNGQPLNASPSFQGGYKTTADLAADKIREENAAKLATQPQLDQATTRASELSKSDQAYATELNGRVAEGFNLKRRNAEILQQINDYQTGVGGSDVRMKLASNIKNLMPGNSTAEAVAEKINGGSVVSSQTLHNLVAGAMITSAISALQGQGRLNKAEVEQFRKAAENPETDPGALRRIIAIQNQFADQDFEEQQARAKSLKAGTYDPQTWQADFSAQKWGGAKTPGSVFAPVSDTKSATLRFNPATGKIETVK